MPKMPVFLIGKSFWKALDKLAGKMMMMKLIGMKDTGIFMITDDLEEVVKAANKIGHPKIAENFYDGFREASAIMKS